LSVAVAGVRTVGSLHRLALDGRAGGEMLFPVANLVIAVAAQRTRTGSTTYAPRDP
jgi:hypothetical protein